MRDERLGKLRASMHERGLGGLVVTKLENVRYLSGFTGDSGFAVITMDKARLVTDGRFKEQAGDRIPGWETVVYARDLPGAIASLVPEAVTTGLEDTSTIAFQSKLSAAATGRRFEVTDSLVEDLRLFKDRGELDLLRAAAACALQAWKSFLPMVQPGVTERQLAAGLDYRMVTAGADRPAFDTIVASGPNASMPHAGVTDRELREGDQVIVDFGASMNGYNSDITRTIAVGEPRGRASEIAGAVRGAWEAAFSRIEPGVPVARLDEAARKHLEAAGLSEHFVHSLGHGIGLEVHEKPSLSRFSGETLEPGMVFTVEPGVYLEGETGARHEEMVLLTEEGPVVLSG